MSFIGDFIGSITGTKQATAGAEQAAALQSQAAERGIAETQRQFDKLVELMQPFVAAGYEGLEGQRALTGLAGPGAQQAAIAGLTQSPEFQALSAQGQEAILQNAAATGGLRGGNTEAALAQFQPALLAQLIDRQYGRLGGITQLGQSSAAGQGAAGINTGANIANLLSQQGAAQAGGALAHGNFQRQLFGDISGLAGTFAGLGGTSGISKLF